MQQAPSKTPCRRIGLRRIPSVSKSGLSAKSPDSSNFSGTSAESSGTPNSRNVQLLKENKKFPSSRNLLSDIETKNSGCDPPDAVGKPDRIEHSLHSCSIVSSEQSFSLSGTLKKLDCQESVSSVAGKRKYDLSVTPQTAADFNSSVTKKLKPELLVTPPTMEDLHALQRNVMLKERKLKELRQADIILKKHDPDKLNSLIQHWLRGCQEALQELLSSVNSRGNQTDMENLLRELGIPASIVHYNVDSQDFE